MTRNAIVALSLVLAACSQTRKPAPQAAVTPSAVPSPIEPPDQSVFTHHPRTVHFRWSAAPQAATYSIEIDCYHCCVKDRWCSDVQGTGYVVRNLKQPAFDFDFWGDQAGRWRVWAVDARSQPGRKSAWSNFSFRGSASP
jgi:hypothetical protein